MTERAQALEAALERMTLKKVQQYRIDGYPELADAVFGFWHDTVREVLRGQSDTPNDWPSEALAAVMEDMRAQATAFEQWAMSYEATTAEASSSATFAGMIKRWLTLLAVQPPPPVGSPTTEQIREFKVYICDDCLHLRGEMCHEPGCRFCRRTMAEVAEYLDVLLIRPIINGVGVIVDRGEHL